MNQAMTQQSMDFNPVQSLSDTHEASLRRVKSAIASTVRDFLLKVGAGAEFSMLALTEYVRDRHSIAPDSAGRVLRDMNQRGEIQYELVSRSKSLYRVLSAQPELPGQEAA